MNKEGMPPEIEPHGSHAVRNALAATALTGAILAGVSTTHETTQVQSSEHVLVMDSEVVELPADPSQLVIELPGDVLNKYQRDFETDTDDKESSLDQVSVLLESQLGADDWNKVIGVRITGMASAEDEAIDQGLQDDSTNNQDLATQRASLAKQAVSEVFAGHDVNIEDITTVDAREDTWTDDEVMHGEAFADQFGYKDVATMVEAYNLDSESAPPAVIEFLEPLLDANRGATITITLEDDGGEARTIVVPVPRIETQQVTKDVETTKTEVTSTLTIGNIPETYAAVEHPSKRFPKDHDFHRGKGASLVIKGQKPIKHRGRTHMTGPYY